jgi:hypothetical protein
MTVPEHRERRPAPEDLGSWTGGRFAVFRGVRRGCATSSRPGELLRLSARSESPPADGADWSGEPGCWVAEVPFTELDAWSEEQLIARWRGELFAVTKVDGDRVAVWYLGQRDSAWATANGLAGDWYNGFSGWFPVDEVEFWIEHTDLLARWKEGQGR